MNRDDIIKLAREAGFREPNPHDGCMGLAFDYRDGTDTGASLQRFAALVAKNERDACAQVCDEQASRSETSMLKAKSVKTRDIYSAACQTAHWMAQAIRARGAA